MRHKFFNLLIVLLLLLQLLFAYHVRYACLEYIKSICRPAENHKNLLFIFSLPASFLFSFFSTFEMGILWYATPHWPILRPGRHSGSLFAVSTRKEKIGFLLFGEGVNGHEGRNRGKYGKGAKQKKKKNSTTSHLVAGPSRHMLSMIIH